ncbi:hypothetical protein R1sor_004807 [Riccia sorocarpa]|uniref:VASt domain-containing protein n=1 Tax=Riccia sorocarpa TaxID=122646 RepID=A0ABD3HJQ5_9MARC
MVRQLKLHGFIECVEPQAAFSFLFGDDSFVKRYHKEMNEDPYAEVSSWTADGQRTVKFLAPISAPNVIKKVIGVDTLRVTEVQQCVTVGNQFTVKSDPTIESPKGFKTVAEMLLTAAESGKGTTVYITATLECKAGVWGVQGTIENFMEMKAKKSFLGWLKLARQYCQEQVALATGLPFTVSEGGALGEESDDEFFDFSEEDEKVLALSSESRSLGLIYSREGEAGLQNWLTGHVTGQLNGIRVTCDASRSHLEHLNRKLQKLEEDIGVVQRHLEHGMIVPQSLVWGLVGMGVATGVLLGVGHMYLKAQAHKGGS